MWMNEYEIENAANRYNADTPNLEHAARTLVKLVNWTNSGVSDGWPYWKAPGRAANKLMNLIQAQPRWDAVDITDAELRKALTPLKSFLTRQGVDHDLIISK